MSSTKASSLFLIGLFLGLCSKAMGQAPAQDHSFVAVDGMWGYQTPAQYTILPRPATHSNKGLSNVATPQIANIQSRPTQPYAYGWFGTKPSPKWSRQFGSQNAYTQWTLK